MAKTSEFEHKFRIGASVKYPDGSELKSGKIDKVIFRKTQRDRGEVKYLVMPKRCTKNAGVRRDEEDLVAA